ncbi:hypothetical protein ACHAXR_002887, partial [Thalassiosira sp. AJA248-18]
MHRIYATTSSAVGGYFGVLPSDAAAAVSDASSASASFVASDCSDCASAILQTYIFASFLWYVIISSAKRSRQHSLGAALIALAVFKSSMVLQTDHIPLSVDGQHVVATRGEASSWKGNAVRISFSLHSPDELPYPDVFSKKNYRCDTRPHLPSSLSGRTVLNFTTSIHTDLNIIFVGDSIGAQFSQAFEYAALGKGNEGRRWTQGYRFNPKLDWVSDCVTVSPSQGGGISAFWRMTGLMARANKKVSYYHCDRDHHNDKGWSNAQALTLLDLGDEKTRIDAETVQTNFEGISGTGNALEVPPSAGAYDAFVMRVPHGWLSTDQITKDGIVEEISLIIEYLGVETIVISTLPLCNNVVTAEHWRSVGKINSMIREIARNWPKEQIVLVQEFGNYTNQIIWSNARHIGLYNGTMPDFSTKGWEQNADFLFERLFKNKQNWPPSKAQVCATQKSQFWFDENKNEHCKLNRISVDGSHWCINSLGPRHSASVACLLGCVYNGGDGKGMKEVRACEAECNDRFMSIQP